MTPRAWHCEYAWLGGEGVRHNVLVEVSDNVITAVSANVAAPGHAQRLDGFTLPGFANAHSHAFHRALRGRTHGTAKSFWTWRDSMYALADSLEPDTYFALARATFAEMAMAGVTCVGEFHYLHHASRGRPYDNSNAMGIALLNAARDAGLRITLLDTCYLRGGPGEPLSEVQRRFSDGTLHDWAARVSALLPLAGSHARIGAAVHSVRAVDADSIRGVAEWSRRQGAPLHAHVSEQPAENEQCIEEHAMTPVQLLARCGALSRSFTAVHATHLTGNDIELLGNGACTACFCPTTERDLADGIGPSATLAGAGAALALGSDSHAMIDMLEETRALELNERLSSGRRANHATASLFQAATVNGHASLGWRDAGRIAVGQLADLVTVRLDSVRTAGGTHGDVAERVVFAATSADVHHVVAGGQVVVRDGTHLTIDVANELSRAIAALT